MSKDIAEKKNIRKIVIFIIALCLFLVYLILVFDLKDSEKSEQIINGFYSEEKNTLDGVYFGSSGANRYWIAPKAYKDKGICIYTLATSSQPMVLTKYLIEEVLKTQDPKLLIIELRTASEGPDDLKDVDFRRVTDCMKLSENKFNAIKASLEYAAKGDNGIDVTDKSYYFPFLKYHSRWNGNVNIKDFLLINEKDKYKGFFAEGKRIFETEPLTEKFESESMPLDPAMEVVLDDLLDYCDTLDCEVLFVLSPYAIAAENEQRLNTCVDLVRQRGYTVRNYNTEEERERVDIDISTDFYNVKHVNLLGAEKYTEDLGAYIKKKYDFDDHRGDEKYESWEEAYDNYIEVTEEGRREMVKRLKDVE